MNVIPFEFESKGVRVVKDDAGQSLFVASDVCSALEVETHVALRRLDDDEKGRCSIPTLGGMQEMSVVNESGLYSLILGSRKASAKRFKKWVTAEVLPSIRKTGSYGVDPMLALNDPAMLRGLLANYSEKVIALESRISAQAPKVAALDRFATGVEGSMCVTDAAKHLQMQPRKLFAWLQANQWIYRRVGSVNWIGYQIRVQSGLLEHKVTTVSVADDQERMTTQVRITAKGIAHLSLILSHPQGSLLPDAE